MARWGVQQRVDRRRADGCEQSQSVVVSIICHLGVCAMLARHCTARRILSPFCHCYHCLSPFITSCHSLLCIVTLTHMPWHTLSKEDAIRSNFLSHCIGYNSGHSLDCLVCFDPLLTDTELFNCYSEGLTLICLFFWFSI